MSKKRIIINVFGDFVAKAPESISFSPELESLLIESDYNVCNFEAPVSGKGTRILKSGPSLSQSPNSPSLLENKGFNVILMANNHIMDYGRCACEATVNSFKKAITVGVGDAETAYKAHTIISQGMKIGVLSLVQHEFGIVDDSEDYYGAAWIGNINVKSQIDKLRREVDYLFVFPHAGVEYLDAPLPEWRATYKTFIDWGADAVIASHPHVPQGWEYYKDKPIFYSLGNFYFDCLGGKPYWNAGLFVSIELEGCSAKYTVNQIIVNKSHIAFDSSEDMKMHLETINNLLRDEKLYKDYINEEVLRLAYDYKYGLLRGVSGIGRTSLKRFMKLVLGFILNRKDSLTLLNMFRCESHRWVWERYLHNFK